MFKMYCVFVVCFSFLMVSAAPLEKDSEAEIVNNEYRIEENGNYRFSFDTSNGISREETGTIVNMGQPNEHILVVGRYSYINTDGQIEMVEYSADQNGYSILPPRPTASGVAQAGVPGSVVATLLGK